MLSKQTLGLPLDGRRHGVVGADAELAGAEDEPRARRHLDAVAVAARTERECRRDASAADHGLARDHGHATIARPRADKAAAVRYDQA